MRINLWKVSTLVLAAALTVVTASGHFVQEASAEAQPRMRTALDLLNKAKDELKAANPDKGGHRVKAIESTEKAIEETKAGIEFDNKH